MESLNAKEKRVIEGRGTELAFTGRYWNHFAAGVYLCRKCGSPLYASDDKFRSKCGWPSFDSELPGAVRRSADPDGQRVEISCASCGGHLGHVFEGEHYTEKNVRHCVNSISLVFQPLEAAIFAGGCFWGVEHFYRNEPGVFGAASGYTGGSVPNPSYREVCTGRTGHAEAVRVLFDPSKISYEKLARLFFEIHDPTQVGGQGPDMGSQYRSAVFYTSEEQKSTILHLIEELKQKGWRVVTEVVEAGPFYFAEDYHQDYFGKNPGRAVCHMRYPRFEKGTT